MCPCVHIMYRAAQGVHGAFKERMLREVMRQDKIEYGDAYAVLGELNKANEEMIWLFKMCVCGLFLTSRHVDERIFDYEQ